MTLPSSGQISLNDVNVELGNSGTAQIDMNSSAVRGLFDVASGEIEMSDGYGKSDFFTSVIQTGNLGSSISDSQAGDVIFVMSGSTTIPADKPTVAGYTLLRNASASTQWATSNPPGRYYCQARLAYKILDGTETSVPTATGSGGTWHQYRFSAGAISTVQASNLTSNTGGALTMTEGSISTDNDYVIRLIGVGGYNNNSVTQTMTNVSSEYPRTATIDTAGSVAFASMSSAIIWTSNVCTTTAGGFQGPAIGAVVRLNT